MRLRARFGRIDGMRSHVFISLTIIALLLVSLEACVSTPRAAFARAGDSSECVVLLHGLNRSWRAMQPMAEALREAGFTTANVDYPSQAGSVEILAPMAVIYSDPFGCHYDLCAFPPQ